jgi:hypothetical protein
MYDRKLIYSVLAAIFVVSLTNCGAISGKKVVNYYQGGQFPKYRKATDGRYYPIDAQGRFVPFSLDYRGSAPQGDNDEAYKLPKGYQMPEGVNAYQAYPYQQQAPRQVPRRPQAQAPQRIPYPTVDNDGYYALPTPDQSRAIYVPSDAEQYSAQPAPPPPPVPMGDNDAVYALPNPDEYIDVPVPSTKSPVEAYPLPGVPHSPQVPEDFDVYYQLPQDIPRVDDADYDYPIYYDY